VKLLVVVVCYKVPDLTVACLRSLAPEIGRVPGARVAVVENGTSPEAADQIRRAIDEGGWSSWCDLTVIPINLGFTGGNNVAIRPALQSADPPEYVFLLNADTIVLEGALPPLVQFMDVHPRVGIAGAHCVSSEEGREPLMNYARFAGILSEFDRGLRLGLVSKLLSPWIAVRPLNGPGRVDWLPGAAMILRRSMLDEIGLLDEGLYTYFDDLDICLRARRAGWETWYVPESSIVHLVGQSTGVTDTKAVKRTPSYWFQARRRYFLKSYGGMRTAMADAAFIAGYALYRVRRWVQRKPDLDPPHYLGDFIRHSVLRTGFALNEVENPAMRGKVATPLGATAVGGMAP
jgi:GT2 family glycosyltransferase